MWIVNSNHKRTSLKRLWEDKSRQTIGIDDDMRITHSSNKRKLIGENVSNIGHKCDLPNSMSDSESCKSESQFKETGFFVMCHL